MKNSKIGIKVFAIVAGIIIVITVLSILFCVTVLPGLKYHTAIKNAQDGNYTVAVKGLYKLNYKNSEELLQEYAFEAGKNLYEAGDKKNANVFFGIAATSGYDSDIEKQAYKLFEETSEE